MPNWQKRREYQMTTQELIAGLRKDLTTTQRQLDLAIDRQDVQAMMDYSHDLGLIRGQLLSLDPTYYTFKQAIPA
jgi:hypothetical protein